MLPRIKKSTPKSSFFLFGPRGVGKTTWIKHAFPNARYIDLLDYDNYWNLKAQPSLLRQYLPESTDTWIIIDEVQKIPAILDEVHRQIELKKHRFILTGSSARKLKQKSANMLAGRALTQYMYPLTSQELQKDFNLNFYLKFGGLPTLYDQDIMPQKYLISYVQNYLKEEVLQESVVRNYDAFEKFLQIASFSHAEVINYSSISREVGIDRKTVMNYFQILQDLLIAHTVSNFTQKSKRKMIKNNKFYFFDVGVFRCIRPRGRLDSDSEIEGAALEGFILQELHARFVEDSNHDIYFWRTQLQQEVDFVIYGTKRFAAIEVKRSKTYRKQDSRGLKLFLKDYPQAKAYLIYLGDQELMDGNIHIMPIEKALRWIWSE